MINIQPTQIKSYIHDMFSRQSKTENEKASPQKMHSKQSLNELILSSNSYTSPYYYANKYARGEMGAVKAVRSYALSNVPFYSYYTIYDKVRHKEVSKDDAIKAVLINTLANLS